MASTRTTRRKSHANVGGVNKESMDKLIDAMAWHVGQLRAPNVTSPKKVKAMTELAPAMDDAVEIMEIVLAKSDDTRATLIDIFGGDCKRIVRLCELCEGVKLDDKDARRVKCLKTAESVKLVLKDMGLMRELVDAEEEAKHADWQAVAVEKYRARRASLASVGSALEGASGMTATATAVQRAEEMAAAAQMSEHSEQPTMQKADSILDRTAQSLPNKMELVSGYDEGLEALAKGIVEGMEGDGAMQAKNRRDALAKYEAAAIHLKRAKSVMTAVVKFKRALKKPPLPPVGEHPAEEEEETDEEGWQEEHWDGAAVEGETMADRRTRPPKGWGGGGKATIPANRLNEDLQKLSAFTEGLDHRIDYLKGLPEGEAANEAEAPPLEAPAMHIAEDPVAMRRMFAWCGIFAGAAGATLVLGPFSGLLLGGTTAAGMATRQLREAREEQEAGPE